MFTCSQLHQNSAQSKVRIEELRQEGEASRLAAEANLKRTRRLNGLFVRLGSALIAAGTVLQPTAETKPVTLGQRLISER
jgi:hypothetical protein